MRIYEIKRLFKFLPRHLVQLIDRKLRILNGRHQIIPLPPQESIALLALLEFLQRHHVHRTHGVHARLHLVVIRFRRDQLLARQQLRFLGHQFFRLRVQFRHARLPQIIAVRIVPRLLDLPLPPLRPQFIQRLSLPAHILIELRRPRPRPFPFRSQRRLQFFQPRLLRTQLRNLHPQLLAGTLELRFFQQHPRVLLLQRSHALAGQRQFRDQGLLGRLRSRKPLGHRRQFFAPRHHLLLQRLEILAQLREPRRNLRVFRFRRLARLHGRQMFAPRIRRALPRRFRICMQPRNLRALRRELLLDSPQFSSRLIALVRRRHQRFFRFHLPRNRRRHLLLGARNGHLDTRHLRLLLVHRPIQPHRFRFVLPQFALQRQRPCLARAPSGNHASVIASSFRSQKITVRVVVRHLLGQRRALHHVSRAQLRQKIFRRRPQRLPEFPQTGQPPHHPPRHGQGSVRFRRSQIQFVQRVHEERRASAHLIAQQRNSRARLVERFHDHVLQFIAQKLFDRAFVLFLHLGVVRQQSHRAKRAARSIRAALAAHIKKFLHRIRRVSPLAQYLLDRSVPRTFRRKSFAHPLQLLPGFLLPAAQFHQSRLRLAYHRT